MLPLPLPLLPPPRMISTASTAALLAARPR
jgi:hypothetical protein